MRWNDGQHLQLFNFLLIASVTFSLSINPCENVSTQPNEACNASSSPLVFSCCLVWELMRKPFLCTLCRKASAPKALAYGCSAGTASTGLPNLSSLNFHRTEYKKGCITPKHTPKTQLKGLWEVSYTSHEIKGVHFYEPCLFLVGTDQVRRWVELCKTAGKEPGKNSRNFVCFVCSKSPFAAPERLLGKSFRGHDCVCLKTLSVRDNYFCSLIKAM